jgi:hypothetical protein
MGQREKAKKPRRDLKDVREGRNDGFRLGVYTFGPGVVVKSADSVKQVAQIRVEADFGASAVGDAATELCQVLDNDE